MTDIQEPDPSHLQDELRLRELQRHIWERKDESRKQKNKWPK